jgi:hypothetical protein
VKVELEQLVLSILDDPSIRHVMREASFSSTVVKSTIEQSLTGHAFVAVFHIRRLHTSGHACACGPLAIPVSAPAGRQRLPQLNPRLVAAAASGGDHTHMVLDVMHKPARRNPPSRHSTSSSQLLSAAALGYPATHWTDPI